MREREESSIIDWLHWAVRACVCRYVLVLRIHGHFDKNIATGGGRRPNGGSASRRPFDPTQQPQSAKAPTTKRSPLTKSISDLITCKNTLGRFRGLHRAKFSGEILCIFRVAGCCTDYGFFLQRKDAFLKLFHGAGE